MAATLVSGFGMALGARHAVSVVDQGADDLARWIDLPLSGAGAGVARKDRPRSNTPRPGVTPSGTSARLGPVQSTHAESPATESGPRPQATRHAPPDAGVEGARAAAANEKPGNAVPTVRRSAKTASPPGATWLTAALDAPGCQEISAYIISAFEHRENSVATLSTNPKGRGRQRRVGEKFGEYRVIRIDYNARRMSSAVWLTKNSQVCQVLLRAGHPVRERLQSKADRQRRATLARARKAQRRTLKRFEKRQQRKARVRRRARSRR